MPSEFMVRTHSQEELVDITNLVKEAVTSSHIQRGVALVYVPHTTAGVTINESADPNVVEDILETLQKIVPAHFPYHHLEGNAPAHIKASMMGSSVSILVEKGNLLLGTWQGIFFCEFDGPRTRQVWVEVRGE
ncbi:MAG TPA: secondary thiamine-phosphate synthase enzyme YjbQ [Candidatus Atribacteria bacterium]|nr:secondary thiamine-phosphate synthase enzyme YjbQ [Candidatus Atribacteria bacterium]